MKQIFEILQEERDRIINLHEDATQNQYLIISEENAFMTKGRKLVGTGKKFTFKDVQEVENTQGGSALKFFGGTTFVPSGTPNLLKTANPVSVQFADTFGNAGNNGKGTIYWSCSKGKFYIKNINPDNINQLYGYDQTKKTYYFDGLGAPKFTGALKQVCENDQKGTQPKVNNNTGTEEVKQGTDSSSNNKYPLTSDHVLYASNNKAVLKVLKNTTISFYPDKNGAGGSAQFIEGDKRKINVWFNCGTGKFLAKNVLPVLDPTTNKTIPAGQKTFTYYTDKPFKEFLQKKCERLKKGSNSGDSSNTGTDSAGLGNSTGNSTGGSVVTKPNDTALDTILQKISGAATQKPTDANQGPQTFIG